MRITIESTTMMARSGDKEARLWTGKTEEGRDVLAFVFAIAPAQDDGYEGLEAECIRNGHVSPPRNFDTGPVIR